MVHKTYRLQWMVAIPVILATCVSTPLHARPLDLVEVDAVSLNCIFSTERGVPIGCIIDVEEDVVSTFTLTGLTGEAGLQSRTNLPGAAGTAGEGLRSYSYNFRLVDLEGSAVGPCVSSLTLPQFAHTRIDFNDDGDLDDAWVSTRGSPGGGLSFGTSPSRVEQIGTAITFIFNPPICAGDSSHLSGLASPEPPTLVTALVGLDSGETLELEVVVPAIPGNPPEPPCEIDGISPSLPFPSWVPVCGCLQDRVARAFRCGILYPNLILERTVPWPVPIDEPFFAKWSLTALQPLSSAVSVTEILPAGVNAQNQSSQITFPHDIAVDDTVELKLALTATENIGAVASSATVNLPGGDVKISGLGFNVETGNKAQQGNGIPFFVWLAIIAGGLLIIGLLWRSRRN